MSPHPLAPRERESGWLEGRVIDPCGRDSRGGHSLPVGRAQERVGLLICSVSSDVHQSTFIVVCNISHCLLIIS